MNLKTFIDNFLSKEDVHIHVFDFGMKNMIMGEGNNA